MNDYINKSVLLEDIRTYQMDIVSKATAIRCINAQPTVDEKEIIRKTVERIVERLEDMSGIQFDGKNESYQLDWCIETKRAIEILKEECGLIE